MGYCTIGMKKWIGTLEGAGMEFDLKNGNKNFSKSLSAHSSLSTIEYNENAL